jgi:quinol monooxygenase YgiN
MLSILMRVNIKPGRDEEFCQLVSQLIRDVRQNEPDCLAFDISRSDENPLCFIFYEKFATIEAFNKHPDMPYHAAMSAKGWDCVDGQPLIERMTPLSV